MTKSGKAVESKGLIGLKKAERMAQLIEDKKGLNILILDVRGLCNFTDYFVLSSGLSKLQLSAIGAHIDQTMKDEFNERPISREGQKATSWVVLDYGDVIVHVMTEETRDFYRLEDMWGDAEFTVWAPAEDHARAKASEG